MNLKTISRFEPGSYGEQCAKFFDDTQEWHKTTTKHLASRAVTWAYYPNRYMLTQYADEFDHPIRPRMSHVMFEVVALSALRTETGLRDLRRWSVMQHFLHRSESLMHFSFSVDSPEEERSSGELARTTDFVMENGLYVPNGEELAELDAILDRGWMDGYSPVIPEQAE